MVTMGRVTLFFEYEHADGIALTKHANTLTTVAYIALVTCAWRVVATTDDRI